MHSHMPLLPPHVSWFLTALRYSPQQHKTVAKFYTQYACTRAFLPPLPILYKLTCLSEPCTWVMIACPDNRQPYFWAITVIMPLLSFQAARYSLIDGFWIDLIRYKMHVNVTCKNTQCGITAIPTPLSLPLLSWLYSPLLGFCRYFSFLILFTVSRATWTEDQPVTRPVPITYRTT
jgi:hypothetical protein